MNSKVCDVASATVIRLHGARTLYVVAKQRKSSRIARVTYFQRVEEELLKHTWDAAIVALPSEQDALSGKVAVSVWLSGRDIAAHVRYSKCCLVITRGVLSASESAGETHGG